VFEYQHWSTRLIKFKMLRLPVIEERLCVKTSFSIVAKTQYSS